MFYSFQSDQTKISGVSLICIASDFLKHNQFLAYDLTLSRYNLETEARSPKPTTFSESWVREDSVGTGPEKFPVENFQVRSGLSKKSLFREFTCPDVKTM